MTIHISKKLDIEDRKREIRSMLARSKTQQEIADKLNVDRTTISKDIKALKQESQQFVHDLSKSDLAFYYEQCLNTLTEVEREAWVAHDRAKSSKDRLQIWKVIIDCAQAHFNMFKDGPGMQHIKSLHEKLDRITNNKDES